MAKRKKTSDPGTVAPTAEGVGVGLDACFTANMGFPAKI
jgi:hypothetical protein